MLTRLWLLILLSSADTRHSGAFTFPATGSHVLSTGSNKILVPATPAEKKYNLLAGAILPSRAGQAGKHVQSHVARLEKIQVRAFIFWLTSFATSEGCHFLFLKVLLPPDVNLSHCFCFWSVLLSSNPSCCYSSTACSFPWVSLTVLS